MAIKFACNHCGRPLSVKDELAGKKGPCPACKKLITIPFSTSTAIQPPGGIVGFQAGLPPRPAPISADDAERAAAEVLANQTPPPEPAAPVRLIEFPCPHCDETIKVGADLEGKQTPCPNPDCRRIVRVPRRQQKQALDWRRPAQAGPSLARRDGATAPEGAWGSEAVTGVSTAALSEAGVLPEEVEKTPVGTWIRRGAVLTCVATFVLGVTWWSLSSAAKSRQDDLVKKALKEVDPENPKLGALEDAIIYISAGEYALRTGKKGSAKEASD